MQRNRAGDVNHGLQLVRRAAEMGSPEAQAQMGGLYEEGQGFRQDYAQAKYWYEKAAAGNNCAATTRLGLLYESGKGVNEDWVKAAQLYQRGASRGCVGGESHLGLCYQRGMGVPQDRKQAVTWFRRAAQQGDKDAAEYVRLLMDRSINLSFIDENELASICRGDLGRARWLSSRSDPKGILFHNSQERADYLVSLRDQIDRNKGNQPSASESFWEAVSDSARYSRENKDQIERQRRHDQQVRDSMDRGLSREDAESRAGPP